MDNLKSTKGKTKIVHEGYIYVKQKNLANGLISYECELRKNGKQNSRQCKAKIKVLCGDIVGYVNEHIHAPVVGRPEALKVRADLKDRAVSTLEIPQQVMSQNMTTVTKCKYI